MAASETPAQPRRRDPDATRDDVLTVATTEFAEHGYHGCRVDEIAARTRTTKRSIYYHFGSKDALYEEVLERAYRQIRDVEATIDVDDLEPVDALRELAGRTFDHHEEHPEFLRLVAVENLGRARHLASERLRDVNSPAIATAERILERGRADGSFVRDTTAVELHALISAICVFRVSNRHTFSAIFGVDLMADETRERQRRALGDLVVEHLTRPTGRAG